MTRKPNYRIFISCWKTFERFHIKLNRVVKNLFIRD